MVRPVFGSERESLSASDDRSLTDVQADVEGEFLSELSASSESCEVATELDPGLSMADVEGLASPLEGPLSGESEPK